MNPTETYFQNLAPWSRVSPAVTTQEEATPCALAHEFELTWRVSNAMLAAAIACYLAHSSAW
jgi:hypothetical protein